MRSLTLLALLFLFAGCANVRFCNEGDHEMCLVENSSWLLLNAFPLVSGDPEQPNKNTCRWFTTTATLENNIKMLESARRSRGASEVRHPVSYTTEEMVLFILFKRYVYHTSAELVYGTRRETHAAAEELLDKMIEESK